MTNLLFDLKIVLYINIETSENEGESEEIKISRAGTNPNEHPSDKLRAMEQLVILTTSALTLPPPSPTVPRDLWTNKVEFLLSVIGYVVDLGSGYSNFVFFLFLFIVDYFRKCLAISLYVL